MQLTNFSTFSAFSAIQGWIIQCAQCAYAHKTPPHWRRHHKANVKIVIELKFVIQWLKCIETTTTKKVISFYGKEIVEAPPKRYTLCPDWLIRPCCYLGLSLGWPRHIV